MFEILGGRKIVASLIVLIGAITVTYFKADVPPGLVSVLQVVFGGFVFGNGIEHLALAYRDRYAPEADHQAAALYRDTQEICTDTKSILTLLQAGTGATSAQSQVLSHLMAQQNALTAQVDYMIERAGWKQPPVA